MKPRIVVLLSGTLTLGVGYWLSENSRDAREIWLGLGCWILGFWFASSIMSFSNPTAIRDADEETDEEEYEEE
jgi:hypothetical protein